MVTVAASVALLLAAGVLMWMRLYNGRPVRVPARLARFVRTRLGTHRLRDVHEAMVDLVLDHRVPGVRKDYLPNVLVFGWHPDDLFKWAQLTPNIAVETTQILTETAGQRDYLLAGEITITIVEDTAAAPGRPTLRAGSRAGSPAINATVPIARQRSQAADATVLAEPPTVLLHSLVVRTGEGTAKRVRLVDGLTVGRDREAGVRLADASVSARHARFSVVGARVRVMDLGSANGTYVNGHRINHPTPLETGDWVAIGSDENRIQVVAG